MDNNLKDKLKELKQGYLKKLEGVITEFKGSLNSDKLDIMNLYSKIHTISGTAGMYGLTDLSEISTEFEMYLKVEKENIEKVNQVELRKKFTQYISSIEEKILLGE